MPTIDATIGGASANSYQSVSDSDTYFADRLNTDDWSDASADNKARAKIMATRRLNRENWYGARVTTTQALAWPRIGVLKPDGSAGFGLGNYYGFGECYLDTEIPDLVKQAENELALAYLQGFSDDEGDAIEEFQEAGGMRVKFRQSRPDGVLPATVTRLISPLLAGSITLVRGS